MTNTLHLGVCEIELDGQNHSFIGFRAIRIGGTTVRSSKRPMGVEIRNPNGILIGIGRELGRVVADNEIRLRYALTQESSGPMEFLLHTVRPRYNTADWTLGPQPLEGELEVVLKPIERTFGETRYQGFSYQYLYKSPALPIYKILDRGTWEIDGKAVGNEIWQRNGTVASIMPVESLETGYSTEWFLPGIQQPNIFQFFPLQTAMQGFTLTFSDKGALMTWPTEVAHVRTLIEKPSGVDLIIHWHEHCGDLVNEFATAPVEVLFAAKTKSTRVDRLNLFEEIRASVWSDLHRQIGMREDRVVPYGVMEEWGLPDLDRYRTHGLPKLADAGVENIMIPNEFENNMNVYGVSNMCCTVDLRVAETVGEKKLADLCSEARQRGITIEMWGNTAISTLTEIFSRKNPGGSRVDFLPEDGRVMDRISQRGDPWVRNLSGAIEADHYTPVFAVMNLRNQAVRDYWLERWGHAHREIGLEGIFVDSAFNLSSDKFHYLQNAGGHAGGATIDQTQLHGQTRPAHAPNQAVLSQYKAYLELLVEMQALGYAVASEDVGLFGVSRSGPDCVKRAVCLPLWLESLCNFDARMLKRHGFIPDDVYFAGLAYRVMWQFYWNPERDAVTFIQDGPFGDADRPTKYHTDLLKAFGKVGPQMVNRHIGPDEAWVRYEKDGVRTYWMLNDAKVEFDGPKAIEDVLKGTSLVADVLEGRKHGVYVVR